MIRSPKPKQRHHFKSMKRASCQFSNTLVSTLLRCATSAWFRVLISRWLQISRILSMKWPKSDQFETHAFAILEHCKCPCHTLQHCQMWSTYSQSKLPDLKWALPQVRPLNYSTFKNSTHHICDFAAWHVHSPFSQTKRFRYTTQVWSRWLKLHTLNSWTVNHS